MKHNKKPPKGSRKFANTGKLATGSLLTGLVAMSSSCSSDMEPPCLDNSSDRIYGTHAANLSRGATFISLDSIALSDEFRAYVSVMSTTLQDILADQNIAYQFCQNPEGYLQNRFSGDPILSKMSMELSNADKNFLLATTDKDIQRSLLNGDFHEFITLCNTKGFLHNALPIVTRDNYRRFFKSEEDYLKFQEYIRSNNTNGIVSRSPSQEMISQAWAIAIPVAGVAIAGLELAVVFDQVAWTTKMSYTEASSAQMSAIAEQEPIMKLWIQAENSPSVDVSTMYNELVVNRATEAVNLIETEFPSVDKEALRDFFILNIGTSYGFKQ